MLCVTVDAFEWAHRPGLIRDQEVVRPAIDKGNSPCQNRSGTAPASSFRPYTRGPRVANLGSKRMQVAGTPAGELRDGSARAMQGRAVKRPQDIFASVLISLPAQELNDLPRDGQKIIRVASQLADYAKSLHQRYNHSRRCSHIEIHPDRAIGPPLTDDANN